MDEFIIRNIYLVDGSGAPGKISDVLIAGDRIKQTGEKLSAPSSVKTTDGAGLTLCPGFIDAHSHSDLSLLAAPEATGKITQGITTEITGNCGLSAFPVTDRNRDHLEDLYRQYRQPLTWRDITGYAAELNRRVPAVNIASLCGHNTLRAAVAGYEKSRLDSGELENMNALLRESLEGGAAGLSTGLLYVPGKFSDSGEITGLLKIIKLFDRQYATHLRSEGNFLLESLAETIETAQAAGLNRLHISHLKTAGRQNWHKLDKALQLLEDARNHGTAVTADRYPYTESMTQLSVILPSPYDDLDDSALKDYLSAPEHALNIRGKLDEYPPERWDNARLVSTGMPGLAKYHGKPLAQIAEAEHTTPTELCLRILRHDATGAMAAFSGMNRENMHRILFLDYTFFGTDESARPTDFSFGISHPRGFGSAPEFIRILSDAMPLEQIISKMTSQPAKAFGLTGRGMIAPGCFADMVLFDPAKLTAKASFAKPHQLSEGIEQIWVNGVPSTSGRAGKFIAVQKSHF